MFLLLLVFIASFLGSLHCGLMCCHLQLLGGGLGTGGFWHYHLSRGLGYLTLGLTLRLAQNSLATLTGLVDIENFLTLLLVAILITLGLYMLIYGRKPHLPKGLSRRLPRPGKALGFLTALMPCGWLWVFLTLGLSQPSVLANAELLAIFWLGTLTPFLVMRFLSQSTLFNAPSSNPAPGVKRTFFLMGSPLNRLLGILILLTAGLQYSIKTGQMPLPELIHDLNKTSLQMIRSEAPGGPSPNADLLCQPQAGHSGK